MSNIKVGDKVRHINNLKMFPITWIKSMESGNYDKSLYVKIKPKLEDFYDTSDPRGCSSSEYQDYLKALKNYEQEKIKKETM